ncbi:hypothetical protein BD324DRAFT_576681 [Kockovaella imperatae]|uniref:Nucleotide-diphospho-sugar transferase n=1 Tax=Kockovaella imperatae TaxID=4999 RepID=A0A1Y1UP00_9TREE|nr:hypothetical protein BD324DRAFT_576681 [Kockovaella imperatae]ORX39234.1 hypothetical protein BD324DRAFT_576681 [Kockovaella imperatae]
MTLSDQWGWHERMGWKEDRTALADLGELAEQRYRLGFENTQEGKTQYFERLRTFAAHLPSDKSPHLSASIEAHLPPFMKPTYLSPADSSFRPPAMISYKKIHQTDKKDNHQKATEEWIGMNEVDGWKLNFLDDDRASAWVEEQFRDSDVSWAWQYMHRGVLRADFLRYLLPLLEGGVYSDVDTTPLRPIEQWGRVNVENLDISNTDGPDWEASISTFPSVVVAVDVDVHKHPTWMDGWPRPLGICQWTLSSAPYHPIFIDAARRVVNATRVIESWETWRSHEISRLESTQTPDDWQERVSKLRDMGCSNVMSVMEWTGPGLFSDSVLSYLLARYDVSWHRLRGLNHPLRIGDVMILPITAFSPGGQPDFGAEGTDSVQANVVHNFRGSWKGDGA